MSSIVNVEYLEDRDEVQVTWPGGTVHRYALNVGAHQLTDALANSLNCFWASGKMDTMPHWVNAPHDLKWTGVPSFAKGDLDRHAVKPSFVDGPITPVLDSSMSLDRLTRLADESELTVTYVDGMWSVESDVNSASGTDLPALIKKFTAGYLLYPGPANYSAVSLQEICTRHGITITCTGNVWQIIKGEKVLQADYKLDRALKRLTRGDVS